MKTHSNIGITEGLTLGEAMHLQALEGNPLDDEQMAMFLMFDREGWTDEQRIEHLRKRALERFGAPAAE